MTAFPNFDGTQNCAQPGINPEIFHPQQNGSAATAKRVCGGILNIPPCPFLAECREYGVTHSISGVWGGWADDERKADRKARRIVPEPLAFRVIAGAEITTNVLRRHGNWAGIAQHERYKDPLCDECRAYRNGRRKRRAQERGEAS